MKYVFVWLIGVYQKLISPLKPSCCRFSPTCSSYAKEAFLTRGFIVGFYLSFRRILRCNPFSRGGYDPVPQRRRRTGRKYKSITRKYDGESDTN